MCIMALLVFKIMSYSSTIIRIKQMLNTVVVFLFVKITLLVADVLLLMFHKKLILDILLISDSIILLITCMLNDYEKEKQRVIPHYCLHSAAKKKTQIL